MDDDDRRPGREKTAPTSDDRLRAPSIPVNSALPLKRVAALASISVGSLMALVLLPSRTAAQGDTKLGDRHALVADTQQAFVAYWRSRQTRFPHDLQRVVDHASRSSLFEAVFTTALLISLAVLGRTLWKAYFRSDGQRPTVRRASAWASFIVWVCALAAVWSLTRDLQDAFAPLAAVLPMLLEGAHQQPLATILNDVQQHLAPSGAGAAAAPPALQAMLDANARFHLIHAVLAAPTAIFFLASGIQLWRRKASTSERHVRRTTIAAAVACVLLFVVFALICVINVGTAADPQPSLYGLFRGSW